MSNNIQAPSHTKLTLSAEDRERYIDLYINTRHKYVVQQPKGSEKKYLAKPKELTDDILFSNETLAVYQLAKNSTVKWALLDLDIEKEIASAPDFNLNDWQEPLRDQVRIISDFLEENDIPHAIEFSGRRGIHFWIHFNAPEPAAEVRQWVESLVDSITLVSEKFCIDIFPAQSGLNAQRNDGNAAKLPLQLHRESGNYTYFITKDLVPLDGLPKITKMDLPPVEVTTVVATAATATQPSVVKKLDIDRLPLVISNCEYTKELLEKIDTAKYLTNDERIWLGNILVQFGEDVAHQYFSKMGDYKEGKTQYHLDKLNKIPSLCSFADKCKNKRCPAILSRGNKSPIAFAYNKLRSVDVDPRKPWIFYNALAERYQYYLQGRLLGIKKDDIDNLLKNFNLEKPPFYPHLIPKFDPFDSAWIDLENSSLNFFQTTKYLELSRTADHIVPGTDFPTILRLLENIALEDIAREYLCNWLSVILNTRKKLRTAIVFRGPQGGGKNLLYSKIISTLFGRAQSKLVDNNQLEDKYNGYMRNAFFVGFNEVAHDNRSRNRVNARLKSYVTDEIVSINDKYDKTYETDNRANFMFFSNEVVPIVIEAGDRRYTVIETGGNLTKLKDFGDDFVDNLTKELPKFAQYLKNYPYDAQKANKVLDTASKKRIMEAAMDRFEEFAMHLKENDGIWLKESQEDYIGLKRGVVDDVLSNEISTLTAKLIFNRIYTDSVVSTQKLKKKMEQYGITTKKDASGCDVYFW